jgi:hypothetical protein
VEFAFGFYDGVSKAVYSKPIDFTLDSGCKGPCDGTDYKPKIKK